MQKNQGDWYIEYEINAFTKDSDKMSKIYSNLHANILDVFAKNNIEIMSPHYMAVRDGNKTTIPNSLALEVE